MENGWGLEIEEFNCLQILIQIEWISMYKAMDKKRKVKSKLSI